MAREVLDDVARRVRQFYEGCSFPGYEDIDTPLALAEKAGRGVYMQLLDDQVPWSARVLDAGCGTGQLVNFLAVMKRPTVGIDLTYNSLAKGRASYIPQIARAFRVNFRCGGRRRVSGRPFRPR